MPAAQMRCGARPVMGLPSKATLPKARDGREQRRLASAVGADQADDLALPHVERGLVDGPEAAERLAEAAHLKHGAASV
jgi:hypothetical protein